MSGVSFFFNKTKPNIVNNKEQKSLIYFPSFLPSFLLVSLRREDREDMTPQNDLRLSLHNSLLQDCLLYIYNMKKVRFLF